MDISGLIEAQKENKDLKKYWIQYKTLFKRKITLKKFTECFKMIYDDHAEHLEVTYDQNMTFSFYRIDNQEQHIDDEIRKILLNERLAPIDEKIKLVKEQLESLEKERLTALTKKLKF